MHKTVGVVDPPYTCDGSDSCTSSTTVTPPLFIATPADGLTAALMTAYMPKQAWLRKLYIYFGMLKPTGQSSRRRYLSIAIAVTSQTRFTYLRHSTFICFTKVSYTISFSS